MKTLHFLIIIFIIGISFVVSNNAYGCNYCPMIPSPTNVLSTSFYTDKTTYVKGDNILIYGSVGSYSPNTPVTIQILDNKNNSLLVSNTYTKPDDSFIARIPTNNTEWKSGGPYDVKVQYGSVYIGDSTFVFYADQLSPLKQADAGIDYASITCDSGLVTIMKQEDGTVACVKPSSMQKLISLNWGYDPSEKLTVYGLKSIYKAGQEIDFKFRINAIGDPCGEPQITVKDSNQKIVWQSSQYAMSCQAGLQPYSNYQAEGSLGNNTSAPGYPMGLLRINQPGTYSLNILWWSENVTKTITVIQSQTNQITNTKTNDPFGITALIIYHPQIACLTPPSHSIPVGMPSCPPNNFYLKINSNSTAYLLGYNICDDNSCAKNNDLSILLPINTPLYPNYQSISLPVNLQWKYGDTVNIQLEVSPNADNKMASLVDLGNSAIVP